MNDSPTTVTIPNHYKIEYRGKGEDLFGLCLQNFIFRVLTLNIYYPWAKTEFRKHVWANTFFHDQALVYKGLGIEIFKGFCKVIGIYLVYLASNAIASAVIGQAGSIIVGVAGFVLFMVLVPRVILGAYRYRLTRTTWRGVRFGLKRIEKPFTWLFFKGSVLTILTLGFYAPVFYRALYKARLEATVFGSLEFRYTGDTWEEYVIYIKGVIFSIFTLGFYRFWFSAELNRYRMNHTHMGDAVFECDTTGGDFFKMQFLGGLALIFTLGLAFSWVFCYGAAKLASKTRLVGNIDFDNVVQSAVSGTASGEAASDFFDLDDGFLSFDL